MRSSERRIATHPELPLPVLLCPLRGARQMRLRLDERSRMLKVTHPRSVRPAAALAWAATHREWVERQIRGTPPAEPFVPGVRIPFDGAEIELSLAEWAPRRPVLVGNTLRCGGSAASFARRIEAFLKARALETLSLETGEAAARLGLRPTAVSVGDARTRWGSCSSSGHIRYSWRLILAPPEVRRYVVAHEVAHLKHLNHGREFKELERELFGGDTREAQELLRRAAPRLRRIGIRG